MDMPRECIHCRYRLYHLEAYPCNGCFGHEGRPNFTPEQTRFVPGASSAEMYDALRAARAAFNVEYSVSGAILSVSHSSDALRPLIALLDAALDKADGKQ